MIFWDRLPDGERNMMVACIQLPPSCWCFGPWSDGFLFVPHGREAETIRGGFWVLVMRQGGAPRKETRPCARRHNFFVLGGRGHRWSTWSRSNLKLGKLRRKPDGKHRPVTVVEGLASLKSDFTTSSSSSPHFPTNSLTSVCWPLEFQAE